jgi:hypothetical protein
MRQHGINLRKGTIQIQDRKVRCMYCGGIFKSFEYPYHWDACSEREKFEYAVELGILRAQNYLLEKTRRLIYAYCRDMRISSLAMRRFKIMLKMDVKLMEEEIEALTALSPTKGEYFDRDMWGKYSGMICKQFPAGKKESEYKERRYGKCIPIIPMSRGGKKSIKDLFKKYLKINEQVGCKARVDREDSDYKIADLYRDLGE